MRPPDTSVPDKPKDCQCCDGPFYDGEPTALIRSYNTNPSHPDWGYWWVCSECLVRLASSSCPEPPPGWEAYMDALKAKVK